MSLQVSMRELDGSLALLEEAVSALHVTVAEDRPTGDVPALVDHFDNAAAELRGLIAEARAQVHSSQAAGGSVASALQDVHRLVNRLSSHYWRELARYEVVSRLVQMADENGRKWQTWCRVTRESIAACAEPLARAESVLLDCWGALFDQRVPAPLLRTVSTLPRSPS